ncbi:MAG: reductive dehalogenase, partial [Anaerolineales bacterium]
RGTIPVTFLGNPTTKTPEEQGIPKWEGTPEENARMIRVAARWFGASEAGFVKVTEKTKKLFWASKGGKEYVFEDVDAPDETESKKVFPNKDLWAIVYTVPQSMILTQRASQFGGFGTPVGNAYAKCVFIESRMVDFIHALGYQHMGGGTTGIGPSPAWGVMAGLGELSRTNRLVSPKYGNAIRTNLVMITDLPLAESKPIDAGIWKFCHTCKKCGELCPSNAICMDDEPSWETASACNTYGVKAFHDDGVKCFEQLMGHGCTICHAVCPYNKMDEAVVHDLVKMTISKAPVFNGVIRNLDDAFGYGYQPNGEDFWQMEQDEFPLYGLDPSRS